MSEPIVDTRKISVETAEVIVRFHEQLRLSHRQIADKTGVSRSSVRNILNARRGIKRKPSRHPSPLALLDDPAEHFGPMCAWIRHSLTVRMGPRRRSADVREAIDEVLRQIRSITEKIAETMTREENI